jgi:hypothetical protein
VLGNLDADGYAMQPVTCVAPRVVSASIAAAAAVGGDCGKRYLVMSSVHVKDVVNVANLCFRLRTLPLRSLRVHVQIRVRFAANKNCSSKICTDIARSQLLAG